MTCTNLGNMIVLYKPIRRRLHVGTAMSAWTITRTAARHFLMTPTAKSHTTRWTKTTLFGPCIWSMVGKRLRPFSRDAKRRRLQRS